MSIARVLAVTSLVAVAAHASSPPPSSPPAPTPSACRPLYDYDRYTPGQPGPRLPPDLDAEVLQSCDVLRVKVTKVESGPFTVGSPPRFTAQVVEGVLGAYTAGDSLSASFASSLVRGLPEPPFRGCGTTGESLEERARRKAAALAVPMSPPQSGAELWVSGGWNAARTVFVVTNDLTGIDEASLRDALRRAAARPGFKQARARAEAELLAGRLDEPLLQAAEQGDSATVSALLKQGARPTARRANGDALTFAVNSGDEATVQALLDTKHPALRDDSFLLGGAVAARRPALLRRLLKAGLQPAKSEAINEAVRSGQCDLLPLLVSAGGSVSQPTGPSGADFYPLEVSLSYGNCLEQLLEAGANIDQRLRGGVTLLMMASTPPVNGFVDVARVKKLLDRGANPRLLTPEGQSVLFLARNTPAAVELLKKAGAVPGRGDHEPRQTGVRSDVIRMSQPRQP